MTLGCNSMMALMNDTAPADSQHPWHASKGCSCLEQYQSDGTDEDAAVPVPRARTAIVSPVSGAREGRQVALQAMDVNGAASVEVSRSSDPVTRFPGKNKEGFLPGLSTSRAEAGEDKVPRIKWIRWPARQFWASQGERGGGIGVGPFFESQFNEPIRINP
jgi:hypothetical protein